MEKLHSCNAAACYNSNYALNYLACIQTRGDKQRYKILTAKQARLVHTFENKYTTKVTKG
jgi:hypothetical protein